MKKAESSGVLKAREKHEDKKMRKIKITGCAAVLPDGGKVKFGSQTRYRLQKGQTLLDLAERAAMGALCDAGLDIREIDLIIAGMATPLQAIPCNAALIHERIAKGTDIPAMDINTSCTSFITAFDMAAYLTDSGRYKNILIVSGDTASAALNPKQRESYELFSDAAAAFVVSGTDEDSGVLFAAQKTWSEGAHDTEIRGGCALESAFEMNEENRDDYYFDMKGLRVLRLCAHNLPSFFEKSIKSSGMSFDDIALVIPHQASKALGYIMPRLGIGKDKYIDRVKDYGNMISASVPFMLCAAIHENKIRHGDNVMLTGTAAGLTCNILIFRY